MNDERKGELQHEPRDTAERLVTVYSGPMTDVVVRQSVLAGEGVFTHIADQNIKNLDPFATGGRVFDVDLQVPLAERERALEILQESREPEPDEAETSSEALRMIKVAGFALVLLFLIAAVVAVLSFL